MTYSLLIKEEKMILLTYSNKYMKERIVQIDDIVTHEAL